MTVRDLNTIGAGAALAVVLGIVCKAILPSLPYGGSISLEPLPILFVSLWRGPRVGVLTGILTGLLQLLISPYILHPIQLLLDYPVPFALIGLAAVFPGPAQVGIVLANVLRFCAHFVSGIVFFGAFAPEGTSVWVYAALYNAFYIVPETIIAVVLVPVLVRRLPDS